jgi:hypothetical protein
MGILGGGVTAIVAIFAGMLAQLGPVEILERAVCAFAVGWMCGQVWYVLVMSTRRSPDESENTESPLRDVAEPTLEGLPAS